MGGEIMDNLNNVFSICKTQNFLGEQSTCPLKCGYNVVSKLLSYEWWKSSKPPDFTKVTYNSFAVRTVVLPDQLIHT